MRRSGIMLAYHFEERRLLEPKFGWNWPVIVQPKYDGHRCRLIKTSNEIILLSSEENRIFTMPHIEQAAKEQICAPFIELDGELYCHGMQFEQITSLIKRNEPHHDHHKMRFYVFDVINKDIQLLRMISLTMGLDGLTIPFIVAPYRMCHSMQEIYDTYRLMIDNGYEGIIIRDPHSNYVRKRSVKMLKFKPKKTDQYQVLDVIEAISKTGSPKGMVGAFLCTDGDEEFKVSAGTSTHREREIMWKEREEIIGKHIVVQYQSITSRGIPKFGIYTSLAD